MGKYFRQAKTIQYSLLYLGGILLLDYHFGNLIARILSRTLGTHLTNNPYEFDIINTICIGAIILVLVRSYDILSLLNKEAQIISILLLISAILVHRKLLNYNDIGFIAISFFCITLLFQHYQTTKAQIQHLAIGGMTTLLSLLNPVAIFLLIIWLYISNRIQSLNVKNTLALILGVIIPVLLFIPVTIVTNIPLLISTEYSLFRPSPLKIDGNWCFYFAMLTMLMSNITFFQYQYTENVKQRVLGECIVAINLFSITLSLVYPESHYWLLSSLSSSILLAKWLSNLKERHYRFIIIILLLLVSVPILLN